jgi:hypothetical protein
MKKEKKTKPIKKIKPINRYPLIWRNAAGPRASYCVLLFVDKTGPYLHSYWVGKDAAEGRMIELNRYKGLEATVHLAREVEIKKIVGV